MSNEAIKIELGEVSLRSIGAADQELLRVWRNATRDAFFYRETIEASEQARWFSQYLLKTDDFLFMVEHKQTPFGCLGLRWKEDKWDVYNVIRRTRNEETRGKMGSALRAAISFVLTRQLAPVQAIVLASNPAVSWYLSQGFKMQAEVTEQNEDCVLLHWADNIDNGRTC